MVNIIGLNYVSIIKSFEYIVSDCIILTDGLYFIGTYISRAYLGVSTKSLLSTTYLGDRH